MKKMILLLLLCAASLNAEQDVLLFAGSLRQGSLNKKLVKEAAAIAEELGARVRVIDLKDYPIPFYDGDEEEEYGMPENARIIRQYMINSQVIMMASPNYNRFMPAVLKNLLDWASRNENAEECYEAFKGKTFALMCSGPGASGGVKGLDSVRSLMQVLKGNVLQQQFVLPYGNDAYDAEGHLKDADVKENLRAFVAEALQNTQ
jgi:chromate reductase, NAD(P)H dehydrogenase (quinone)